MSESRIFKPLRIGNVEIKHRIGMAPLTRMRSTDDNVPVPLMKEYYSQRASDPGTLIITEGTFISPEAAGGFPKAPGIWSREQVAAWKTITDEVHHQGCFIFCQIFSMGRAATANEAKKQGLEVVGPSAIPIDEHAAVPRALTVDEIRKTVQDFANAAKNAIDAGFDGVEIHGGNGYLIDQFLQDTSNQRDDEYGGSVENRSRFAIDIIQAVVSAVGPERVGFRLSPWSPFQGMRMEDPIPQFSHVIAGASRHQLAYLHLVESRMSGANECGGTDRLDFAYNLWTHSPILVAGGYKGWAEVRKLLDDDYPDRDIVTMFGRYFLANPDLIYKLVNGLGLNAYDRSTFYTSTAAGYTDYPFSPEYLASQKITD
ncbi:NADH:flavin oxidoreductase/NADH oxidase family protein-like protein [Lasiosphaeria hispida]|uniref:NADH:flavin oxidoreductase/NADH oxidase family protein-like protein n=1 Tax=Lasiosphaeria hispida TaxID=260671 RepID=A0AAJ0HB61_9PEZI|nr:NADH:flavin oxidoreductase/NADH oxidase family protein-like protein [Lasiosphaeria hispida]